jgi:hypothetical protein
MLNFLKDLLFRESHFFSYKEQLQYQIQYETRNETKMHQGIPLF